jgi:HAD superfamily hydrolase (TIGR01549 family)
MPAQKRVMQATITKRRFDAVVFDLDGTLADTFSTIMRIFNQLMFARTGRRWNLDELIPYFGPPETVMFKNLFPNESDYQSVATEFYRLSLADGHEIIPFTGIREIVSDLRNAGVKLGVYSGASTRAARIRTGHAGLLDLFDEVIGGDQVSNHKPHPEGLIKLIDRFEVDPGATVYIGDMVADVEVGRGAGATTVAVTWGAGTRTELEAAMPDFIIENPNSLREIIDRMPTDEDGNNGNR